MLANVSAHHRLMVVVVESVFAGELGQVGRIPGGDVVEAHRNITLFERLGGPPLLPEETVCSTQENRSAWQPLGFRLVAFVMSQSSCCCI